MKDITSWLVDRHGEDYERKITTRWVGSVIRRKLHLATCKSHGNYVIPLEELPKLDRLYARYGIAPEEPETPLEADPFASG